MRFDETIACRPSAATKVTTSVDFARGVDVDSGSGVERGADVERGPDVARGANVESEVRGADVDDTERAAARAKLSGVFCPCPDVSPSSVCKNNEKSLQHYQSIPLMVMGYQI